MTTHNVQIIRFEKTKEVFVTARKDVRTPEQLISEANAGESHRVYENIRNGLYFTVENPVYMQGIQEDRAKPIMEHVIQVEEAAGYTSIRTDAKRPHKAAK